MKERPIPGTPQYFELHKQAFRSIADIRTAYRRAEGSPSYIARGMNADGEPTDIEENTGPWDRAHRTATKALENPFVKEILEAHGLKVKQIRPEDEPVILNKKGVRIRTGDIPIFGGKK
jgi:hypothetical protein